MNVGELRILFLNLYNDCNIVKFLFDMERNVFNPTTKNFEEEIILSNLRYLIFHANENKYDILCFGGIEKQSIGAEIEEIFSNHGFDCYRFFSEVLLIRKNAIVNGMRTTFTLTNTQKKTLSPHNNVYLYSIRSFSIDKCLNFIINDFSFSTFCFNKDNQRRIIRRYVNCIKELGIDNCLCFFSSMFDLDVRHIEMLNGFFFPLKNELHAPTTNCILQKKNGNMLIKKKLDFCLSTSPTHDAQEKSNFTVVQNLIIPHSYYPFSHVPATACKKFFF